MPGPSQELLNLKSKILLVAAQETLFAPEPRRFELGSLFPDGMESTSKFRLAVWRNHALEPLLSSANPYFTYGSMEPLIFLHDYDDSLSFDGWEPSELELLWLDASRYLLKNDLGEWLDWLASRIAELREISPSPILVATWFPGGSADLLTARCSHLPAVYVADLQQVASDAAKSLLDESSRAVSGTPLNPKLHPTIARSLACHWISGAVLPPLKAVFVDLDNTLYGGVLGEDTPAGLELSEGHQVLQEYLLNLKNRGIFLGLVSRNRLQDVKELFRVRNDFPLALEDFSVVEASWDEKHLAVVRGLELLNIGSDSVVFVDDNPGEVLSVARSLPDVLVIQASEDAELTALSLEYTPGLWRWSSEPEDLKRVVDQKANSSRTALLTESRDYNDYLESLGVQLTFNRNPRHKIRRLSDLSLKTNQFNLSLMRLREADIVGYMEPGRAAIGVSLEDRLSDSGMIGMVLVRFESSQATIDEVVISCRALGRRLEDSIVLGAIRVALDGIDVSQLSFSPAAGTRNEPALKWLRSLAPTVVGENSLLSNSVVNDFEFPTGMRISIEGEE